MKDKWTAFSQSQVGNFTRDWERFTTVYEALEYTVKTTGGNDLTHQINCSYETLQVVLEISKSNYF